METLEIIEKAALIFTLVVMGAFIGWCKGNIEIIKKKLDL